MFQILVVEDDRDLNRTVCAFLNNSGYQATGCLSAGEAYDAMYEIVFDLIVSDIMMPGIDGFEFAKTVRSLNENIPILFMTARDDLSYLTINLRGTCALVTVTEKDPERTAEGPLTPCDIYADRAGIVEAMTVREGEPCVQVGDTVIPGDLLVSGRLVSTQGEERLVPADADVTLRTWPAAVVALHPGQYGYTETGRVFTRWSLQLGSRRFALPHIEKIGDACYYKTMETTAVSLGEGYLFPLTLIRERWHECTVFRPALSEAGCRALLHDTCHSLLEADAIEGSLQEQAFTMIFEPNRIVARLQAEGLEKTGEKTPITGEH